MTSSIIFNKQECAGIIKYVSKSKDNGKDKDNGWKLSQNLGFHKSSILYDYLAKWIEYDGKWSLYITCYNDIEFKNAAKIMLLITVDTLFEVVDYICTNKTIPYK